MLSNMFVLCHKVFSDISYTVASCTENEASRYGKLCFASVIVFPEGHARSLQSDLLISCFRSLCRSLSVFDARDRDEMAWR